MNTSLPDTTRCGISSLRGTLRCAALVLVCLVARGGVAVAGQLGAVFSPGRLAKAHAAIEGPSNCVRCHEIGRKVTETRCLACHQPIADRMARRKGVHRHVTECISCHTDHAGAEIDLRRVNPQTFDHAQQAQYPLDGLHAKVATNCAACHKTRSFLQARPACSSCHSDPHKGSLGSDCTRCHATDTPFKQSRNRFDHSSARFQLTGAHVQVACEKCHKTGSFQEPQVFRVRDAGSCSACHQSPHRGRFEAACSSCHTTERWDTRNIDHAKTRFPLLGAHTQVACSNCHNAGSMVKPVRFEECASCHVNVHRDSIKDDCRVCHTETTFKGAKFDHEARTPFPLAGKHDGPACVKCHANLSGATVPLARKVLDYRGAQNTCVACHAEADPHKGKFGRGCDSCHTPSTFSVKTFRHPRAPEFFGGQHQPVRCENCHLPDTAPRPLKAKAPAMTCASCHRDVHLGQLEQACERCHRVETPKFAASRFTHASSRFQLTGAHETTACAKCHRVETRSFPSGQGTATAFRPLAAECSTCHKDPHFGQVDARCETCHPTTSFKVERYRHQGMDDFFGGFHGKYTCRDCHKPETGNFPAGRGTAVRFLIGRTCAACHPGF